MLPTFFRLELKSAFRSPTWKQNLWMRILIVFAILYFALIFLSLGIGAYYIIEKLELGDPFEVINRYVLYYLGFDIVFRYMLQPMPVANVQPLLYQPISKKTIVHFSLLKTLYSFFNWSHLLLLIPLSLVLIVEGSDSLQTAVWAVTIYLFLLANNYLNILVNQKTVFFVVVATLVLGAAALQYFDYFDLSLYTQPLFLALYKQPTLALLVFGVAVLSYFTSFSHFMGQMYLDTGLAKKAEKTIAIQGKYFERFGKGGLILKNDVALIIRNKRARMAVFAGFFFIFYGLLFFTGAIETYDGIYWRVFAGIFVTGGFLFSFGQYVPSWDSSYYSLLMTQNITYMEYLRSKYTLIQVFTAVTTLLSTWYIVFGWDVFSYVLIGALYNMSVNAAIVLWGGAYVRSKIDLTSSKKAFGDKNAFNYKSLLLTLPKIALPVGLFALVDTYLGTTAAKLSIVAISLVGFSLRHWIFGKVIAIYKKEKYQTLKAYRS
ncbi:MAG: DUF5687 family protein [Flavobacteriaceae bacterium]